MNKTLMIFGVGDLAGLVLNLLVQAREFGKIILVDLSNEELKLRKNLALLFSAQIGRHHNIECVQMDVTNIDGTAEIICRYKPDVIFSTISLQSWRQITYLPKEVFQQLDQAQFGPWLPVHLSPVYYLAQGVNKSGVDALFINAAFPDAIHPVLNSLGLAPTSGIGNASNVVPIIRYAVAAQLNIPVANLKICLIAQHYFSHRLPATGDSGGAPHIIRAFVEENDVSESVNWEKAYLSVAKDFKRTGGSFRQLITAASACQLLFPLLYEEEAFVHAPGVQGLPGGYPCKISVQGEIFIDLPEGVTLDQAIEVNSACQQFDGIESITADGTVNFKEQEMAIMKEILGYECLKMPIFDIHDRAKELRQKYLSLCEKVKA